MTEMHEISSDAREHDPLKFHYWLTDINMYGYYNTTDMLSDAYA